MGFKFVGSTIVYAFMQATGIVNDHITDASNPHIVERIASNFPMLDLLRYTGENLYRFANRNAVKWNAVKAAAEYYNINTDMVVAFGDDINDLEMIKNCGVGVAVENGIEEVKSVAKFICDISDNDGVAKWLEGFKYI